MSLPSVFELLATSLPNARLRSGRRKCTHDGYRWILAEESKCISAVCLSLSALLARKSSYLGLYYYSHIRGWCLKLKIKTINGLQSNLLYEQQRAEIRQDFYHKQTEKRAAHTKNCPSSARSSQGLEQNWWPSFASNWAKSQVSLGFRREKGPLRS